MTPDAAFGFERRGTPEAVAELGARDGFEVVVVPPFTLEGRPVRSAEIRDAIAMADIEAAATLLGRPVTLSGQVSENGRLTFELPMALPPDGAYTGHLGSDVLDLRIRDQMADLGPPPAPGRCTIELRPR